MLKGKAYRDYFGWKHARSLLSFLAVAILLHSCMTDTDTQPAFIVGWVVLGLICLAMVVLFAGVLRYIIAGKKEQAEAQTSPAQLDYEYEEEEEE